MKTCIRLVVADWPKDHIIQTNAQKKSKFGLLMTAEKSSWTSISFIVSGYVCHCALLFQWTVFQKPVAISLEQLVKFRYIKDKNGVDILGKLLLSTRMEWTFLVSSITSSTESSGHSFLGKLISSKII